jgi:hypothetical protein
MTNENGKYYNNDVQMCRYADVRMFYDLKMIFHLHICTSETRTSKPAIYQL